MQEVIDDVIALRRPDPGGLSRAISVSFGVHVGVLLVLFLLPRDWIVGRQAAPILMTISLGGSTGDRSGGLNQVGGRQVDEVAPPPKRPEPIRPVARPDPERVSTAVKAPPKTAAPPDASSAARAATRTPATGKEVTKGVALAETGATGQGTGLTFGGGAGGASATLDSDFCCREYVEEMLRRIRANWKNVQPENGTTVIKFRVLRDGTISAPEVERSSGSAMLDLASRAAFSGLRLPPLPEQYKEDTLTIHLTFPYQR
jgi:TonB family protein